jgi:uncharacterized cupin superfamily protein
MAAGTIVRPNDGRRFSTGGAEPARAVVESNLADFSAFEQRLPARTPSVPGHIHRSYDEGFYVIEGAIEFVMDGRMEGCEPGTFVFVPRGVAHAFGNPYDAPARMLVIGSAGVQSLVEEVAPIVNRRPFDPAAVMAAFARHDSELLPPG